MDVPIVPVDSDMSYITVSQTDTTIWPTWRNFKKWLYVVLPCSIYLEFAKECVARSRVIKEKLQNKAKKKLRHQPQTRNQWPPFLQNSHRFCVFEDRGAFEESDSSARKARIFITPSRVTPASPEFILERAFKGFCDRKNKCRINVTSMCQMGPNGMPSHAQDCTKMTPILQENLLQYTHPRRKNNQSFIHHLRKN